MSELEMLSQLPYDIGYFLTEYKKDWGSSQLEQQHSQSHDWSK
jgi:hypothetical protein